MPYLSQRAAGTPDRWGIAGSLVELRLVALEKASAILRSCTVSEALDAALENGDVFATVTAWGPDQARASQRWANLEALRGVAARYEESAAASRSPATIGGFLAWCSELDQEEQDEKAASFGADAVQVMPYHKAKGLEWPVVICTQLDEDPEPRLFQVRVTTTKSGTFALDQPLAGRQIRFWASPFGAKKTGIALLDELRNSVAGRQLQQRLRHEELRLLYVGMTRARDLLVLALNEGKSHPWLDLVAPGGLTLKENTLELPSGATLPAASWKQVPPEEAATQTEDSTRRHWFPAPLGRIPKLPARQTPSSLAALPRGRIDRVVDLGQRLPLQGHPDEALLGDALHAILAAELPHPHHPDCTASAERVLRRHDLALAVQAKDAAAMAVRFCEWMVREFKPKSVSVECPFHYHNDAGQLVAGFIDLLVEPDDGWVIVDHKSFPGARSAWEEKALSYSGQLAAYSAALVAMGKDCAGIWVHFAVGGGLVRVAV